MHPPSYILWVSHTFVYNSRSKNDTIRLVFNCYTLRLHRPGLVHDYFLGVLIITAMVDHLV